MNRKQLILLLAALVVLGGAGLVLHNRDQQSWDSSGGKLGQKLLPGFQVNDVAAIHVKGGSDLDLVKKNDRWLVQERNDYPANFSDISELLIKMGDLKISQAEPIGSSQLGRMHLAAPGAVPIQPRWSNSRTPRARRSTPCCWARNTRANPIVPPGCRLAMMKCPMGALSCCKAIRIRS